LWLLFVVLACSSIPAGLLLASSASDSYARFSSVLIFWKNVSPTEYVELITSLYDYEINSHQQINYSTSGHTKDTVQ
jgi:hypothetical protein